MNTIERSKFIINRIDHYYNGVNLKGTFFLGVNTFILGGCIAAFKADCFAQSIPNEPLFIISLLLVGLFSSASIAFVLLSILPFLKSGNSYEYKSAIFFGSIASQDFKELQNGMQVSDSVFEEDLIKQIHTLSKGLKSKFIMIRNAGILLFLSIVSALVFFYQLMI